MPIHSRTTRTTSVQLRPLPYGGAKAGAEYGKARNAAGVALELELLARWMDSVFEIPGLGIRFGLDAIVGLIPGIGDALTSLVSLYILRAASRYGVPRVTMVRMAMNIAIDTVIGSIPFVGDAFDVYWKSNLMNVELIRRHVATSPAGRSRASLGDWFFVGGLMLALLVLLASAIGLMYLVVVSLGHFLGI